MAIRLFHVSDQPGIERFEPRPDRNGSSGVWAIAEERLHNYLLPRDCPRVTFYADAGTSEEDRERFLGGSKAVVAIESDWYKRALRTRLYIYEFDTATFVEQDRIAQYYVSRKAVDPIASSIVADVVGALLKRHAELRCLPSLWHLRESVADSTLAFSIIRMRNAAPPPPGFVSKFGVPSG